MKHLKEKLFYGFVGASALLSILAVALSVFANADWYYHLATPSYLYQQLLFTGIALQEFWQIAIAGILLCGQIGGAILGWCGRTKWAMALILPVFITHFVVQLILLLLLLSGGLENTGILPIPYMASIGLNLALLILCLLMKKKK